MKRITKDNIDINSPYIVLQDLNINYHIILLYGNEEYEMLCKPVLVYGDSILIDDGEKEVYLDISHYSLIAKLSSKDDTNRYKVYSLEINTDNETIIFYYGAV